jgi:prepilin-type N-terminal cleavage/methylation domain-containing protein
MPQRTGFRAFTLIELLIVVAIIAILAAIAVPNFLEAQVRAKNSRCKADIRSLATAIESYRVDTNHYPPDPLWYNATWYPQGPGWSQAQVDNYLVLQVVTTPIAYMSSIPANVFKNASFGGYYLGKPAENWYVYWAKEWKDLQLLFHPTWPNSGAVWSVSTTGPDRGDNFGSYYIFGENILNQQSAWGMVGCLYDPTNGTVSAGDVVRIGP